MTAKYKRLLCMGIMVIFAMILTAGYMKEKDVQANAIGVIVVDDFLNVRSGHGTS